MENNDKIKQKTISNLLWRFAERAGAQAISLIISIILARLLLPEDYGTIALVTIFITISQVFVDSGLGNALIQKKDVDDIDFSTVFYFNCFLCCILYAIIFMIAPIISNFYNNEQLVPLIRVLSLTVVVSALKNVQQAYVTKNLMFKKFFLATLCGTIISAILGIIAAYRGLGVWALVIQQLTNVSIDTFVLWLTVKWRPIKAFSFKSLKELFSYGWKLLVSYLINTIYDNIRQLVIGKKYSAADLALYNRGKQFPSVIVTNINSSMDSVLFPVLSAKQESVDVIKKMAKKTISVSCFVIIPLMLGLCSVGPELITILLTEKWLESLLFLQIFCIIYSFEPIQTTNLNVIKALGRSDIFLKLEIIKKTLGISILLLTMNFGVKYILYGMLVYTVLASIINSFPNKKLIDYGYFEQLKDISKIVVLAVIMMCMVLLVDKIGISNIFIKLIVKVIVGSIIYISGACILKLEGIQEIFRILKIGKNN